MNDRIFTLRLFCRVARTGSFTAAGKEVDLSQPSVSRIISKLEKDLGAALFVRSTHAVKLTEAGADYLARIDPILSALEEANHLVRSDGKLALADGDEILILGKLLDPDDYIFWHLKFRDPSQTQEVKNFQYVESLEYSLSQEKLFRNTSRNQEEINLTPQERRLIHYMAQCNHKNRDEPVICSYEELLQASWLEKFGHTNAEVNRLIWSIRNKIETDSGEPKFLQTVKGSGYIIYIKIESYQNIG